MLLSLAVVSFVLLSTVYGEANISISGNVVTKPTPNSGLDPNKWVKISLECVGTRKDLSYYIQNYVNWIFTSSVNSTVKKLSRGFYLADNPRDKTGKYQLDYSLRHDGYSFRMNIHKVEYSDDGTYSCILDRANMSIIARKDANVTVVHPVDQVKLSLGENESDVNETFPIKQIKEGQYTIRCEVTGSNPAPQIDLGLLNETSRRVNNQLIQTVKDGRVAFTATATMNYTLLRGNYTFHCSANLPNDVLLKYPDFDAVNASYHAIVISATPAISCSTQSRKDGVFAAQCQLKSHDQLFCDNVAFETLHNGHYMTYEGNHTSLGMSVSCTAGNHTALTVNIHMSEQKAMEVKHVVVRYSTTAESEVSFFDATTTAAATTTAKRYSTTAESEITVSDAKTTAAKRYSTTAESEVTVSNATTTTTAKGYSTTAESEVTVSNATTTTTEKGYSTTAESEVTISNATTTTAKRPSLQERVLEAQLEWFISQNKKVELEMTLIREQIETLQEKRKLFQAMRTEIVERKQRDFQPFLFDE